MDLTRLDDLKTALQLAGIKPNKALGQHFLIDNDSLEAIIAAGEVSLSDTVVEVGPGLGTMTWPLAKKAGKVIAIEADRVLAELLRRDKPSNLEVAQADILNYDLNQLPQGYKVVANIPYYLTSQLLRRFLEADNRPQLMSLLIQKEVAERIVAKPGELSILALSVQYYGEAKITYQVGRHKFWPAPEVDSAVLQIRLYSEPAFPSDKQKLFRLIKAGFSERRKQLKNSLSGGLNLADELCVKMLVSAEIAPSARAQELSLSQWQKLYEVLIGNQLL